MSYDLRRAFFYFGLALLPGIVAKGGVAITRIRQDPTPITISNIRRIAPDHIGRQFSWGDNSQLFYVSRLQSGEFIYLLDLDTGQTELITRGDAPAFLQGSDHDSIFFLRGMGYGNEQELWCFDIFPSYKFQGREIKGVRGEAKWSSAILNTQGDIYLNPADSRSFAYRFSCGGYCGYLSQIRFTQVKKYGDPFSQTCVLFSRPEEGPLPAISGWLDKDTVLCFIGEKPYRLKVSSRVILSEDESVPTNYDSSHYPDDQSGLLVQGLQGMKQIILPRSNFSPDGLSYLIYSPSRKTILQRDIRGNEVSATILPESVRYEEYQPKPPVFSPDGRHVAFIGLVKSSNGDERTIYVADVK